MADRRMRDLLYPAFYKLGLIKDYVVEEGKSGIWTYEKRASGIAILKGSHTQSSVAFSATGNVYYKILSTIKFPTNFFTETPYSVVLTCSMGNVGSIEVGGVSQTGVTPTILSAVSTARSVRVYCIIEGYWKTPAWGGVVRRLKYLVDTFKGGVCYG